MFFFTVSPVTFESSNSNIQAIRSPTAIWSRIVTTCPANRNGGARNSKVEAPANGGAKCRVLVVDEHPLVRDGLTRVLSQQKACCGQAGTVHETFGAKNSTPSSRASS